MQRHRNQLVSRGRSSRYRETSCFSFHSTAILTLILSMLIAFPASAQLAVSDVLVRSQMSKALFNDDTLIDLGNKSVTRLGEVSANQAITNNELARNNNELQSIRTRMEGNRHHSAKITHALGKYRSMLGELPKTQTHYEVISDINDTINTLYSVTPAAYKERQEAYQNNQSQAKHAALEHAEWTLANMQKRIRDIEALASVADQSDTMKESQDITNRLLLEIMHGLQEINLALVLENRAKESRGLWSKSTEKPPEETETAGLNQNHFFSPTLAKESE